MFGLKKVCLFYAASCDMVDPGDSIKKVVFLG